MTATPPCVTTSCWPLPRLAWGSKGGMTGGHLLSKEDTICPEKKSSWLATDRLDVYLRQAEQIRVLEERCQQQVIAVAELQEIRTAAVEEANELQEQVSVQKNK